MDNKDKAVLKLLVQKELEELEKDSEKVMVSNSPFLGKVALDESDLEFLKSVEKYKEFLIGLDKRL